MGNFRPRGSIGFAQTGYDKDWSSQVGSMKLTGASKRMDKPAATNRTMKRNSLQVFISCALTLAATCRAEEYGSAHYLPGAMASFMDAFPKFRVLLLTSPYRDEVQVPVDARTMEPLPAHE